MHGIDFLNSEADHQSVITHRLAASAALFGWLENDHRGPVEITRRRETLGCAEKHCGMAVVPARMHLAGNLSRLLKKPGRLN